MINKNTNQSDEQRCASQRAACLIGIFLMKKPVLFVISTFLAAAFAPLVIPFTGGLLFFLLHEWFQPSVWGLPWYQSIIGVAINCTVVGYVFTWFLALPLVFILRLLHQYRLGILLIAGALTSFTLPFWQADWRITFLPVLIAGTFTAYAFWQLANFGLTQIENMAKKLSRQ